MLEVGFLSERLNVANDEQNVIGWSPVIPEGVEIEHVQRPSPRDLVVARRRNG